MKKMMMILLALLALSAYAASAEIVGGNDAAWNPCVPYDSLADAEAAAGFTMNAPDVLDGFDTRSIQLIAQDLIEVTYSGANGTLIVRKSAGCSDVSGDYTDYTHTKKFTINGIKIMLKGNADGVRLVCWTNGDYSYSIWGSAAMAEAPVKALMKALSFKESLIKSRSV